MVVQVAREPLKVGGVLLHLGVHFLSDSAENMWYMLSKSMHLFDVACRQVLCDNCNF